MGRKVTAADIQVEIAKGAFRPHTALSNMALSYFQSDKNYFARTIFPMCPVSLSADNYYIFSKEDLLRDSWKRKDRSRDHGAFGQAGRENRHMERLSQQFSVRTDRPTPAR